MIIDVDSEAAALPSPLEVAIALYMAARLDKRSSAQDAFEIVVKQLMNEFPGVTRLQAILVTRKAVEAAGCG